MLSGRVDEIDVQIEKIHRLIQTASKDDPELAAGCATGEAMDAVQRKVDQCAAACEELDAHIRDLVRGR